MSIKVILLAACVALGAAQPIEIAPVLEPQPAETLFRVSPSKPAVLECSIVGKSKQLKYSWQKDGKPFDWTSNPDISKKQDEGSLVFLKPKNEDEGKYQCFAESEYGVASSRVISFKKTFLDTPKVEQQKHSPVEGKPFNLPCAIPNSYPKPEISWVQQLISDPKVSNPVFDRRLTISPEGTLWFSNVTDHDVQDNFKYVCLGKTPASDEDVVLAEHVLEKLVKGKDENNGELVLQYVTKDMTVKAGDVTMIYCIYGGTPLAHPDWFKDGKDVNGNPQDRITRYNRSSGKRLLIKETWLEDQGTFSCKADNEVGKALEHSMFLTVVSAPKFEKQPETHVRAKEGETITIPCQVKALPATSITWTYNAKPLSSSDNVSIDNAKGSPATADLTLKKVKKSDSGYYGCRAINEHGDIYAESLLEVV